VPVPHDADFQPVGLQNNRHLAPPTGQLLTNQSREKIRHSFAPTWVVLYARYRPVSSKLSGRLIAPSPFAISSSLHSVPAAAGPAVSDCFGRLQSKIMFKGAHWVARRCDGSFGLANLDHATFQGFYPSLGIDDFHLSGLC